MPETTEPALYRVIETNDLTALESDAAELIALGYKPAGSVAAYTWPVQGAFETQYIQAFWLDNAGLISRKRAEIESRSQ